MSDVTYVALVPKSKRTKLRQTLLSGDTGALSWREKKTLFGSEFYFTGPAGLVRMTHAYITEWIAKDAK